MKKYLFILLIFYLLFIPNISIKALNTHKKIEFISDDPFSIDDVIKVDDYYYAIGYTINNGKKEVDFNLYKIDASNEIIWTKNLGSYLSYTDKIYYINNQLIITTRTKSNDYNEVRAAFIVYDLNGNFIEDNTSFSKSTFIDKVIYYKNNYYIIYNNLENFYINKYDDNFNLITDIEINYEKETINYINSFFVNNNQIYVINNVDNNSIIYIYDLNFKKTNTKKIANLFINDIYFDNDIYLVGGNNNDVVFLKTDSNLNEIFRKVIKTNSKYNDYYDNIYFNDDEFIVTGLSQRDNGWFIQSLSGANIDRYILYHKYNFDGELIKESEMLISSSKNDSLIERHYLFNDNNDFYLVTNYKGSGKTKYISEIGLLDINLNSPINLRSKIIFNYLVKIFIALSILFFIIKLIKKRKIRYN